MKTLEELNKKWWYRLIKVIYVLTCITVISATNYELYDNYDYSRDSYEIELQGNLTKNELREKLESEGIRGNTEGIIMEDRAKAYQLVVRWSPLSRQL